MANKTQRNIKKNQYDMDRQLREIEESCRKIQAYIYEADLATMKTMAALVKARVTNICGEEELQYHTPLYNQWFSSDPRIPLPMSPEEMMDNTQSLAQRHNAMMYGSAYDPKKDPILKVKSDDNSIADLNEVLCEFTKSHRAEAIEALCDHDQVVALDENGNCRCKKCGKKFNLEVVYKNSVHNIVDAMKTLINQYKTIHGKYSKEYSIMLVMLNSFEEEYEKECERLDMPGYSEKE